MKMTVRNLCLALLFAPLFASGALAAQQLDSLPGLGVIGARNIGPAGMSGRVAAVAVVEADPATFYVGASTGGVFRTTDGGISYTPVFDDQPVLGVGAIAVFQPNPDLVWVGTGEGNPRNSAGVGNGIFRSLNGGESWQRMGLEGSERIHRVLTHPTDPDRVYAGVMGPAWSDGEVRGVYRTLDGGETWERVLYVDERTGVADLVMDPSNPNRLLAALWDFRREPWFFTSGGPGSGLYLSEDGGDTWQPLGAEQGLPEGDLGRIGLAFAPSDPDVVYALVEARRNVLLRSNNGGRTFALVSDADDVNPRPFYYADLRVDPYNENRVYRLHSRIEVSEDAGRTFRTVVPSAIIHGDVHELWIDPADSRHMIMGNDGGVAITWDRGDSWRFVENLTLAQFYHIALDDAIPFRVYGGLQDNGSWVGPSDVWQNKGILNAHWHRVGGGDGFTVLPDPSDERYGYSMSQGGNLQRFDWLTGRRLPIRPIHPDGVPLRFNWNAALSLDPLDPQTLYLGSQFVHRTRDGGASWQIVSPDLTTDDPAKQNADTSGGLTFDATGAEMHTTLLDISPSPVEAGVIWAGSDDGNVQVTRDGGESWSNVTAALRDAPETGWVSDIEPSNHAAGTAWVVFDEHRRGDWTPWIFKTSDFGRSWQRQGAAIEGFVHAIEEDPVEPRLVFAGTEFGLWFSLDAGDSWHRWKALPALAIRDLEVHARDGDLVLGTHARGIWVIDAVHALRELAATPSLSAEPVHLFEAPVAWAHEIAEAIGYRSTGMAMWQGETRTYGMPLTFWNAGEAGRARIEIHDAAGARVAHWQTSAAPGLNRVWWDLRVRDPQAELAEGSEVEPGRYEVKVSLGGEQSARTVEVRADPRIPDVAAGARAERARALRSAAERLESAGSVRSSLARARAAVHAVPDPAQLGGALVDALNTLQQRLDALDRELFSGPECQGI